jgi:hypothetical protein
LVSQRLINPSICVHTQIIALPFSGAPSFVRTHVARRWSWQFSGTS